MSLVSLRKRAIAGLEDYFYTDNRLPDWKLLNGSPSDKTFDVKIEGAKFDSEANKITGKIAAYFYSKEVDLLALRRLTGARAKFTLSLEASETPGEYDVVHPSFMPTGYFTGFFANSSATESQLSTYGYQSWSIQDVTPDRHPLKVFKLVINFTRLLSAPESPYYLTFETHLGGISEVVSGSISDTYTIDGNSYVVGTKESGTGRFDHMLNWPVPGEDPEPEWTHFVARVKTPVAIDLYLSANGSPFTTITGSAEWQDIDVEMTGDDSWATATTNGTVQVSVWFWTDNSVAPGSQLEIDFIGFRKA